MNDKTLVLAPIGKRFSAQFIDEILALSVGYLALLLLKEFLPSDNSVPMLAMWLVVLIYTLLADGMFKGQSIGKKVLGLYVVNTKTNEPCTYTQSAFRNITYLLGFIDLIFLLGSERRRIGDRLASTKVMMAV